MQKEIPPLFIAGIVVIMLGLIAFGAIKAMSPHEKIVKTTGTKLPLAMQQKMLAMQERLLANHAALSTTVIH